MNHATHNAAVNFIWGIADDVLHDVYLRGNYRDVNLPMTVMHRLGFLLEAEVPSEKWRAAIGWIRKQDLEPTGFGSETATGETKVK